MATCRFQPNRLLPATVTAIALAPSIARGFPSIYGGPEIAYPGPRLPFPPFQSAGDGVGAGFASKGFGGGLGWRALRWDDSGTPAAELGHLGTDSGGRTFASTRGINSAGLVVGTANKYNGNSEIGSRAVRWDASTTEAVELGNLGVASSGYTSSAAYAVNDLGTAVGFAGKYEGGTAVGARAVRWEAGGTVATELGNLGVNSSGYADSQAFAINSIGTAVGWADKPLGVFSLGTRAVRWSHASTIAMELGTLGDAAGYSLGEANDINDAGTAVGWCVKYVAGISKGSRAVRWDASGTAATELGTLGTDQNGASVAEAQRVNSAGTAIGTSYKYVGGVYVGGRAVRWDAIGTAATELGNLGTDTSGNTVTEVFAINDSEISVGYATRYNGNTSVGRFAVYWDQDAVAVDLNTILSPADASKWLLQTAYDISNTNWITGIGRFDPDGAGPLTPYDRLFLMQLPGSCSNCPADYDSNGGIDGGDVGAFFVDFESGNSCADVDQDGGVTGSDLAHFFALFESGGC